MRYHKNIYGTYTSFSWSFPGGVPSTSTADSPVVVYPSVGLYNATLTVLGASGNDTATQVSYINVSNGIGASVVEGFEGASFPPALWVQRSQSGITWQQTATAGGFGLSTHSMLFDNFNNDGGGRRDRIITPKLDLTFATSAYVKFDVAYAYYPGYRDTLMVDVSTDCGRTFTPIYLKDTSYLATAPNNTSAFVPAATEWRTDSISLNAYLGQGIELAFDNVGHYGQALFIDNVNIHVVAPPIGINNVTKEQLITVFPNPTKDWLMVEGKELKGSTATITCFSSIGAVVTRRTEALNSGMLHATINLSALPKGLYEVSVQDESGITYTSKVVVQ